MTQDQVFDAVNRPRHYNIHPSGLECVEVTELCSFLMGNAIKYVWRYDTKNGTEDLRKARWYLRRAATGGHAWHLSAKAQGLLERVNQREPFEGLRRQVFSCILAGELLDAVALITAEVGVEETP